MNELRKMDDSKKGNRTQHTSNFSNKMAKVSARKTLGNGQLQRSVDTIKESH
jgi:hypothetical protein